MIILRSGRGDKETEREKEGRERERRKRKREKEGTGSLCYECIKITFNANKRRNVSTL